MNKVSLTQLVALLNRLAPGCTLAVHPNGFSISAPHCPTGEHPEGCAQLLISRSFLTTLVQEVANVKRAEVSDDLRKLARDLDHERTQQQAPWLYAQRDSE